METEPALMSSAFVYTDCGFFFLASPPSCSLFLSGCVTNRMKGDRDGETEGEKVLLAETLGCLVPLYGLSAVS